MWPFRATKAVVNNFALKNASFIYGIGAARWLEHRFDLLAKEGYEQNPIVYACITKMARAVSSVELQLYQKKKGKISKIEDHPVLDLLEHPNPLMGGRKFLESVVTNELIGGNAYILGDIDPMPKTPKPPTELWLLPSDHTEPVTAPGSALPIAFKYKPSQQAETLYPVNQINGMSAVLHIKTVNPLNPAVGLPPLVAAAFGVDTFNSGQAWNKALLDNEARPSGALEVVNGDGSPATLTDEQRTTLKRELDSTFSGKSNAGRPLVLEGGMKWTPMSITPKDMDHRETMLTTARFIAGVFHTPPQLVNIPGESTFSNYAQANLSYYSDTVLPFLETLLEDLNNWLTPLYGPDLYIWYDEEQIPALEPRRKDKADRINASKYMAINEKRRAMGLDDVKGGDVILVSAQDIPLDLSDESTRLQEPGAPGAVPQNPDEGQAPS